MCLSFTQDTANGFSQTTPPVAGGEVGIVRGIHSIERFFLS